MVEQPELMPDRQLAAWLGGLVLGETPRSRSPSWWARARPSSEPDPRVRRGLRPIRVGWVASRFGWLLGGAAVTLYAVAYVAPRT